MPDYSATPYKPRKARKLAPAGGALRAKVRSNPVTGGTSAPKFGAIKRRSGKLPRIVGPGTKKGGLVQALNQQQDNVNAKRKLYRGRTR